EQLLDALSANFYEHTPNGIYWPTTVSFAYSTDGESFTSLGSATPSSAYGYSNRYKKYEESIVSPVTARYIRMAVTTGGPWTFEDEIEVWNVPVTPSSPGMSPSSDDVLSLVP